jgi:hypothetical protein
VIRISREIDNETIAQWDELIFNHPDGCFFQSYSYYKALLEQKDQKPFVVFAFETEELVGVLLAVIQNEPHGIFSFLSSRAIVQGGPIIKKEDILRCSRSCSGLLIYP